MSEEKKKVKKINKLNKVECEAILVKQENHKSSRYYQDVKNRLKELS